MSGTRSAAPKAPATEAALVLAVHGIRGGPGIAVEHAGALRATGRFPSVAVGCHKGEPDLIETVRAVGASRSVVVVPLLMAAGYTLDAIRNRLDQQLPPRRPALTAPLGAHPRFAELIAHHGVVDCQRRGWPLEECALLLVGHGTRRDPTSSDTTRRHAKALRAHGPFPEVHTAFLDEPPGVAEVLAEIEAPRVVVVGLFLDRGEHGEQDIPALLRPAGRRALYTGPVGTDPLVPKLVLDQLHTLTTAAA